MTAAGFAKMRKTTNVKAYRSTLLVVLARKKATYNPSMIPPLSMPFILTHAMLVGKSNV